MLPSRLNRAPSRWLPVVAAVAIGMGIFGAIRFAADHFVSGGAALLLSVIALRWPYSIWDDAVGPDLGPRLRRLGLLGVCLVGAFFRFYQLEPPGLWGDDAINGLLAFEILDGNIRSPFTLVNHAFSTFHALTNFTIAGSFALFGAELWSLRLPGVVASLIVIPLLYGLVSPLFGARTALLTALFFASSPFQLGHAKGMPQNELGLLFEMLGLCLIVRGMLGTRRWLITAAALPVALALYTYHSAKLVPPIAAIALWMTYRLRAAERPAVWGYVAAGVGLFTLCTIPAVVGYITDPNALVGRVGSTAVWAGTGGQEGLSSLWNAVWRTLTIFHYKQGPQYHWFGIGFDPGFTAVAACLLVHGAAQSVLRCDPRHFLLLLWVAIGFIPGFLSSDAPRGYRVLIATPPLYVWAALLPAQLLASGLMPGRRTLRTLAAALVLAVPLIDFNYYFYRVYSSSVFRWFQADHMVVMARRLRALGPGWTGYVLADTFDANYETFRFLARAWNLSMRTVGSLADVVPVQHELEPGGGALFMFARGPLESSAALREFYPDATVDIRHEPTPRAWWFDRWLPLAERPLKPIPTIGFVAVSAARAAAIRGLDASFVGADGKEVYRRIDTVPRLDGPVDVSPGMSPPPRVRWTGALLAPRDGVYRFALNAADETAVWIDGTFALSHERPDTTRTLAQGLHAITIDAMLGAAPKLALDWQPPNQPLAPVPADAFFRIGEIHGLAATYENRDGTTKRIEPLPYHFFFPESIAAPYTARWRGRLEVPRPGGYRLHPENTSPVDIHIDGSRWTPGTLLGPGAHDIEIAMAEAAGAPRLRLYWEPPKRDRELIPPRAFTPR